MYTGYRLIFYFIYHSKLQENLHNHPSNDASDVKYYNTINIYYIAA